LNLMLKARRSNKAMSGISLKPEPEPEPSVSLAVNALSYSSSQQNHRLLERLLWLRVSMTCAALLVMAYAMFVLESELPFSILSGIIVAALSYAAFSYVHLRSANTIPAYQLFIYLMIDAIVLLALVYFSGKASNPFIYYLLILTAIAATIFSQRRAWLFAGFCAAAYSAMLYLDLDDHAYHLSSEFKLHLVGMWINFVASAVLVCFFISRLAVALNLSDTLLAQAREETLKNEHLVGIGTMAASTAHSLGTPLSTIAIILNELEVHETHLIIDTEDHELLLQQIERCKLTLKKLSLLGDTESLKTDAIPLKVLKQHLREHYTIVQVRVELRFLLDSDSHEALVNYNILLLHALINLIDNALYAADKCVQLHLKKIDTGIRISVENDGESLPSYVQENWGKPKVSSKENGLGIGIFLANTTVEKLGGYVWFENLNDTKNKQTIIHIDLPKPANN
jgi:two-component system sensor histidine kinase RegB